MDVINLAWTILNKSIKLDIPIVTSSVYVSTGSVSLSVSCKAILTAWNSVGSGIYTIDPENNWTWFQTYCDMTTGWGWWTYLWSTKKTGSNLYWSNVIDNSVTSSSPSWWDTVNTWWMVDAKTKSWNTVDVDSVMVIEWNKYDIMNFATVSKFNNLLATSSISSYNNVTLGFNSCNNIYWYCWSPSIANVLRTPDNMPCSNWFRNVSQKWINLVRYNDNYCYSSGNSYVNRGFFVTRSDVVGVHPESPWVCEWNQTAQKITNWVAFFWKWWTWTPPVPSWSCTWTLAETVTWIARHDMDCASVTTTNNWYLWDITCWTWDNMSDCKIAWLANKLWHTCWKIVSEVPERYIPNVTHTCYVNQWTQWGDYWTHFTIAFYN